jgi:hypothetical protein
MTKDICYRILSEAKAPLGLTEIWKIYNKQQRIGLSTIANDLSDHTLSDTDKREKRSVLDRIITFVEQELQDVKNK